MVATWVSAVICAYPLVCSARATPTREVHPCRRRASLQFRDEALCWTSDAVYCPNFGSFTTPLAPVMLPSRRCDVPNNGLLSLRSTMAGTIVVVHIDGILDATTRDQFADHLD